MTLLGHRDEAARVGMIGPDFRRQWGGASDSLLVGIVGQVRLWKGQQHFLAAASQVAQRAHASSPGKRLLNAPGHSGGSAG